MILAVGKNSGINFDIVYANWYKELVQHFREHLH